MNILASTNLKDCQQKMDGYHTLLLFRYANLCVKSDPLSLLPVDVTLIGEEKNLEEVASIVQPNEYQLAVYPKVQGYIKDIVQGVFAAHPEFKLESKNIEGTKDEDNMKYILYTMPEVDKPRYDLLTQGVKSLHQECQIRFDEIYAEGKVGMLDILKDADKSEIDEANDALKDIYEKHVKDIDNLRDEKLDEIEDAYMKYTAEHSKDEDDPGYDVVSGMRMPVS